MPKSPLEIIRKAGELQNPDVLAEVVLDIEENVEEMEVKIQEIKDIAETTRKEKGEKGDKGEKGLDGKIVLNKQLVLLTIQNVLHIQMNHLVLLMVVLGRVLVLVVLYILHVVVHTSSVKIGTSLEVKNNYCIIYI